MSSISSTAASSATYHVHPTSGTAQHYNYNQPPHNGEAVHNGTTHSNSSSLGSLPQSQHIGQNVNTTA